MEVKCGVYEKEMAVLRRMERLMCGIKLIDRRNTEELMATLCLEKFLDRMTKASSMQWYGHVLRKEDNVLL